MRAVPIGLLRKPDQAIQVASLQAAVTHATWGGIQSASAVALMSHFAHRRRESMASLRWWCSKHLEVFEHFKQPWEGPVHNSRNDPQGFGVGVNTAWAVCTLLEQEHSLMNIMRKTIEWGGDTDSVASIAWGIASARYPDEILPEFMERDLEPGGSYGVEYLKTVGRLLTKAYE